MYTSNWIVGLPDAIQLSLNSTAVWSFRPDIRDWKRHMYPRSKAGAEKYRKKKRTAEMSLIIKHIKQLVRDRPGPMPRDLQILEFGSGSGYQIPYLQRLGRVVGSDIRVSDEMKSRDVAFLQCSITGTPFVSEYFDLIFSNHVVEHISDLPNALREMRRVGKLDCVYALSVPTNIWLLLSLPAQYYHKIQRLFERESETPERSNRPDSSAVSTFIRGFDKLRPRGHGAIRGFSACYHAFKIGAWQSLFERNSFAVREVHPILLYAPAEWPIVPMTGVLSPLGVCSSALFLMQKE
jgi:SAM-dependent methyltransferase